MGVRRRMIARAQAGERYFRWRGGAVSRLEGLTDAVFALALTLLVVSLEVPSTFGELKASFVQLPVFVCCFAILYMIWQYHFRFHRRYGLEDPITILLNAVLLFLVLFYVYPLKFLCQVLWTLVLHGKPAVLDALGRPVVPAGAAPGGFVPAVRGDDMQALMILYSAGFAGIFGVFALKTGHAWRRREALELDAVEREITRGAIGGHLVMASIGLGSVLLAALGTRFAPWAGLLYFLIGPAMAVHGWRAGSRIARRAAESGSELEVEEGAVGLEEGVQDRGEEEERDPETHRPAG